MTEPNTKLIEAKILAHDVADNLYAAYWSTEANRAAFLIRGARAEFDRLAAIMERLDAEEQPEREVSNANAEAKAGAA